MKKYTVILLYPDYMTDNYGQDMWMGSVDAESVDEAIARAKHQVDADNEAELENGPDDLFVIAVIEGEHQDIKHQAQVCAVQA